MRAGDAKRSEYALSAHTLSALDVAFRAECTRTDSVRSCAAPVGEHPFAHALRRGDGAEIARAQSWWRAPAP